MIIGACRKVGVQYDGDTAVGGGARSKASMARSRLHLFTEAPAAAVETQGREEDGSGKDNSTDDDDASRRQATMS